jgi:hypothetical protein
MSESEPFTIERVQSLRRLTRAVGDLLRDQLTAHLSTLAILFRPRRVLGQYIQGSEKDPVKGADRVYRDLQALYVSVARAAPFTLARGELPASIDVASVTLEIHPVEYPYEVRAGGESRTVTVRSPLTWALSYAGYGPSALSDLLANRSGASEDLHAWIVHQLVLHSVVSNQPGLADILAKLHFPISVVKQDASGLTPLARISSPLSTVRPSDDVIMKSAELSGMDAFEEVINLADLARINDPLKDQLIELARAHGERVTA